MKLENIFDVPSTVVDELVEELHYLLCLGEEKRFALLINVSNQEGGLIVCIIVMLNENRKIHWILITKIHKSNAFCLNLSLIYMYFKHIHIIHLE